MTFEEAASTAAGQEIERNYFAKACLSEKEFDR